MDPSGRSGFPSSCRKRPARWPKRRLGLESIIVRCYPDLGTKRTKFASWPKPGSLVRKSVRASALISQSPISYSSVFPYGNENQQCAGPADRRFDRSQEADFPAHCAILFVSADHHRDLHRNLSSFRVPDLRTKDRAGVLERRSDRFRTVLPLAVCLRAFQHHLVAKGKTSSYEFCR